MHIARSLVHYIYELYIAKIGPYFKQVQECMFEKKDWRMCKDEVKAFRECVEGSKKKAE